MLDARRSTSRPLLLPATAAHADAAHRGRRTWMRGAACALGSLWLPGGVAWAQAPHRATSLAERVLVLVELKGGNDGLNTVVPHADPLYRSLRPTLALGGEQLLPIDEAAALHAALEPLMPSWRSGDLAILQGLGYPQPNLSHFRSIEIWDTGSAAHDYLDRGWVARALAAAPPPLVAYTAEGVAIGNAGLGPLAGARAVSLSQPGAFVEQARLARPAAVRGDAALAHVLAVENDIIQAAQGLRGTALPAGIDFPGHGFGTAMKAVAQVMLGQRGKGGVPAFHVSLGSFDTHQNQAGTQSTLLRQLAEGLASLREALLVAGHWDRCLVLTYAEFGRRVRQNQSNGTDHGTAAPHFALGGAVRGGLHGRPPDLAHLDGDGNLRFSTDFRQVYATVAEQWWGVPASPWLGARFDTIDFLRA